MKLRYHILMIFIKNGKGFNKLKELVQNQGGDTTFLENTDKFEKSKIIEKAPDVQSGALPLYYELADIESQMHQKILLQIVIMLTVYKTMLVYQRIIKGNQFLKVIMIACNSAL